MKIKLTKMQGCGNDFVIIDFEEYKKTNLDMSKLAKKICDRNFGVGADGMIIPMREKIAESDKSGKWKVENEKLNNFQLSTLNSQPSDILADISWYFYNSDGSTAQMCGNGMRCFAKYVYDNKILDKKSFSVKTGAGIIKPEILDNGNVKVNMGTPILEDERIPFKGERKIKILDKEFNINPVSMGNPHCVIFTDSNPMEMAKKYGPYIEKHEYFPEKTNAEFVRIKSRTEVDLCVYERGCGITLACGTGACATVCACVLNNLTEQSVKVNLPGGTVYVEWQGSAGNPERNIFLTGPAEYSFFAEYLL